MRKHVRRIAALTATASLVAACGKSDGSEASEEGPITLRFQSLAWQEQSIKANKAIVEEWNNSHPDIQVEYVQGDWGAVQDQLLTAFEGGDPPDIFHYESSALQLFAKSGFLADLSGLISEDFKQTISDDIWETVQYEDYGTVGVPFLLENLTIFANQKMLEASGVSVPTIDDPWTWDEFQSAAAKMTTDDTVGVAFPIEEDDAVPITLSPGFGGTWVTGTDGGAELKVGEAELDVIRRIHEMLYVDHTADPAIIGTGATDALPGFLAGKHALLLDGTFVRQQFLQQAPDNFEWVMLPPLAGDEGQAQAVVPQTLSVAAQSEHPDAAVKFIEFFLNAENMAKLAEGDWLVPTSEAAQEKLLKMTGGENGWDVAIASAEDLTATAWQKVEGFERWTYQVAVQSFAQYLSDEISEDELISKLKEGGELLSR